MIKLIPVSDSSELNDDLKQIYTDSFPPDERREWLEMQYLINHPDFILNQVFNDQKLIGLIAIWNTLYFAFIEHFAICESMRGKGIGTQVLKKITQAKPNKVVVEVEEPTNESAKRRIEFYLRLGFSVCEGIYYQPPYSVNKNKIKMLLMSFPDKVSPLEFAEIKTLLYREVYQYNDSENFHQ